MTKLTLIPISAFALIAALPLTAAAAGMDEDHTGPEAQMAMAATVSWQDAGNAALAAHPGTLAALDFGDENGTGIYEVTIFGPDVQPWVVKIDATSGAVLDQGSAAKMEDADDGDEDHAAASATEHGETDDDNG